MRKLHYRCRAAEQAYSHHYHVTNWEQRHKIQYQDPLPTIHSLRSVGSHRCKAQRCDIAPISQRLQKPMNPSEGRSSTWKVLSGMTNCFESSYPYQRFYRIPIVTTMADFISQQIQSLEEFINRKLNALSDQLQNRCLLAPSPPPPSAPRPAPSFLRCPLLTRLLLHLLLHLVSILGKR